MIVMAFRTYGNQRYSWIKKQAITVGKPDPAAQLAPQHDQLMAERCVLGFKPALRLKWRGQDGQEETEQRDHCKLTLGDSYS